MGKLYFYLIFKYFLKDRIKKFKCITGDLPNFKLMVRWQSKERYDFLNLKFKNIHNFVKFLNIKKSCFYSYRILKNILVFLIFLQLPIINADHLTDSFFEIGL